MRYLTKASLAFASELHASRSYFVTWDEVAMGGMHYAKVHLISMLGARAARVACDAHSDKEGILGRC